MKAGQGRWERHVLAAGTELQWMVNAHFAERERNVVFFLGKGFDPRMNLGIKAVLTANGRGTREVVLLDFHEGQDSPSVRYQTRVDRNYSDLEQLVGNRCRLSVEPLKVFS